MKKQQQIQFNVMETEAYKRSMGDIEIPLRNVEEWGNYEKNLFFKNYSLIWENRDKILSTPSLYNTTAPFIGLSIAYIFCGNLTLGMLIQLWQKNEWSSTCPDCGGIVRITSWGGSPLSGINKWYGVCIQCKRDVSSSKKKFFPNVKSALALMHERYQKNTENTPTIIRTGGEEKKIQDFRSLSLAWRELEKKLSNQNKTFSEEGKQSRPKEKDSIYVSPIKDLIDELATQNCKLREDD